jgi:hypothetical protein
MHFIKVLILAFADRVLAQSFVEIVWSTKTECVGAADSLVSCFSHSLIHQTVVPCYDCQYSKS